MTSADGDGSAAGGRMDTTDVVRKPPGGRPFRPGQSGNPRGRPKGARNLSTVIAAALSEQVTVTENGRTKRITKLEAAIKQLVNRAASGEARATRDGHRARRGGREPRRQARRRPRRTTRDAVVIAELLRRIRRRSMTADVQRRRISTPRCANDFYSFMVRCFRDLNAGAAYLPSWHVEAMAAKLEGVRDGRRRRLIINVPPRHLKSLAASIALPAWLLGHDPALAIVNVTYGQDLSDKFARDCRAIMTSEWYQALFASASCFGTAAVPGAGDDRRRVSPGDLGRRRADRARRGRRSSSTIRSNPPTPCRRAAARPPTNGSTERSTPASTTRRRGRSSSSCSACTRTISSAMS